MFCRIYFHQYYQQDLLGILEMGFFFCVCVCCRCRCFHWNVCVRVCLSFIEFINIVQSPFTNDYNGGAIILCLLTYLFSRSYKFLVTLVKSKILLDVQRKWCRARIIDIIIFSFFFFWVGGVKSLRNVIRQIDVM